MRGVFGEHFDRELKVPFGDEAGKGCCEVAPGRVEVSAAGDMICGCQGRQRAAMTVRVLPSSARSCPASRSPYDCSDLVQA